MAPGSSAKALGLTIPPSLLLLTEAITAGAGDVRPIVEAMKRAQRRRDDAAAKLEHLDGLAQAEEDFDVAEWLAETRELLAETQDTLEADPAAGRHVLRGLLTTPLTITPVDDGRVFTYRGHGALDRLLTGEIPGRAGRCVTKSNTTALVPPGWVALGGEPYFRVAVEGRVERRAAQVWRERGAPSDTFRGVV